MDLYTILAWRRCDCPEEHDPVALGSITESELQELPDWIDEAKEDAKATGLYRRIQVIMVKLPDEALKLNEAAPDLDPVPPMPQETVH